MHLGGFFFCHTENCFCLEALGLPVDFRRAAFQQCLQPLKVVFPHGCTLPLSLSTSLHFKSTDRETQNPWKTGLQRSPYWGNGKSVPFDEVAFPQLLFHGGSSVAYRGMQAACPDSAQHSASKCTQQQGHDFRVACTKSQEALKASFQSWLYDL